MLMNAKQKITGKYPQVRLRRSRLNDWSRRLIAEHNITVNDLVLPLFVCEDSNISEPVDSMPGVHRLSIDNLTKKVQEAEKLGIPAVALFPVVHKAKKTPLAEEAYNNNNLICNTVKALKEKTSNIGIICDVALDPYTSHGQDGLVESGYVVNDKTVDVLCKQALTLANAGADIVAPSDMMDGRIGAIRDALDTSEHQNVKILSYAAKYASHFYGPFRDAVGSASELGQGDKKTYQMDFSNRNEALQEVAQDIYEGADMVMIKPGMPYLDVIARIKDNFNIPVFAYQVSGEYAMIKAAAEKGTLNEGKALTEALIAFKRAGANGIFTYAALEVAKELQ